MLDGAVGLGDEAVNIVNAKSVLDEAETSNDIPPEANGSAENHTEDAVKDKT